MLGSFSASEKRQNRYQPRVDSEAAEDAAREAAALEVQQAQADDRLSYSLVAKATGKAPMEVYHEWVDAGVLNPCLMESSARKWVLEANQLI